MVVGTVEPEGGCAVIAALLGPDEHQPQRATLLAPASHGGVDEVCRGALEGPAQAEHQVCLSCLCPHCLGVTSVGSLGEGGGEMLWGDRLGKTGWGKRLGKAWPGP